MERVFEAVHLRDIGLVGAHPTADAGMEIVEVFDDESTAAVVPLGIDEVEGKDEGIAELGKMFTKPVRGGKREVGAIEKLRADGADNRAVGAD